MFTRRRIRGWIALLLPLMLLRALLPAGYMPVAADGELRIVMCSAGLAAQADSGPAGHGSSQGGDAGSCLFAHAATFAPPGSAACCAVLAPSLSFDVPAPAQRPLSTTPPRFSAARGPPYYS